MELKESKSHVLSKRELVSVLLLSLSGLIITFEAPSIFLGMRLLLAPCFSLLAFLLYRSYWGFAVAVPSSLATIWLFGDPLTAFRLLGEMGVITLLNRKSRCDNAIRAGRIIRHVAIYAVLIGCPFLYLTEVYRLGTPHNVALTLVYKNFITSIFNVLVSYAVYSWIELKRNLRLEGSRHRISLKTLTSVVLMLICIFLSYSLIRRGFAIASDRSQMLILQRNASLVTLLRQIHRSEPISNPSDFEQLIVAPQAVGVQERNQQKVEATNEYDIDTRNGRLVIVKPEGEKTVWFRLKLNQTEKFLEYKPGFFSDVLPGLETYKSNRMISDQLRVLAPIDGSKLDRLMAGYWSYSHPDSRYSGLREIEIYTPLDAYVRGLAQSTNKALQLLAQVVVVSLFVSNLIAQRLTDEWAAILPKKSPDVEDVDLEELYIQSPITEISTSVASINDRTSEIIRAKKQIEYLNAIAQRQLSTAAEIQRFFLTKIFPSGLSYEVTALTRPAYDVGGDWYDTFSIGKHSFFVVADVCDKGVGSALFMSVFRTLIRYSTRFSFEEESVVDVEQAMVNVITDVNQYMSTNHGESAYFATVFFGHLHEDTAQLSYVSAGHEAALIRTKAGCFAELDATGPALGIFGGASYASSSVFFGKGERLLAYSDGVIDARNPMGEGYGIDRLKDYFDRFGDQDIAEMQEALLRELDEHMKDSEQFDDITMMFIKRLGVVT
jgi:sigma-B regulation protein RsbU (phosphoserine phosphatase)